MVWIGIGSDGSWMFLENTWRQKEVAVSSKEAGLASYVKASMTT